MNAHNLLNGYIPENLTVERADELRKSNTLEYIKSSYWLRLTNAKVNF